MKSDIFSKNLLAMIVFFASIEISTSLDKSRLKIPSKDFASTLYLPD